MNRFRCYMLLCIFSSASYSNTLVPGNYSLNINIIDSDGNYPVKLEVDTTDSISHGVVSYPTYSCSGTLLFKKFEGNLAIYKEKIVNGADVCANGEFHFRLKGNKLSEPKQYLLESNSYRLKIRAINFRQDKWLHSNCYDLNEKIVNPNKKIGKQYSYFDLKKCHKWNLKYSNVFKKPYEIMLAESIRTNHDAKDFITYGVYKGALAKASSKLERYYYLDATTILDMDKYLDKYPRGKYSKEVFDSKMALIFSYARDDLGKLKKFIAKYPDSNHVSEAESNILALKEASREKVRKAKLIELEKIRIVELIELEKIRIIELEIQKSEDEKIRLEIRRIADEKELYETHRLAFNSAVEKNTVHSFYEFIANYPSAKQVAQARIRISKRYTEIFDRVDDKERIEDFKKFIAQYPRAPQRASAVDGIFDIVADSDNVAGYEWFVESYPRAPQNFRAIKAIHRLSFNEAEELDTVQAFNTFIIAYPSATEAEKANTLALKLEKKKYQPGMFSDNEQIDRKAHGLLIAAKKIERRSLKYRENHRHGYIVILNRMYGLLESEFEESEATLRHLESIEFQRFAKTFEYTMRDLRQSLHNIGSNIEELIQVSKKGLSDASADRDLAKYHMDKKLEWEKNMHYQDKGYR